MGRVVVLSGGLDSTVALYSAVETLGALNVLAVSFNYGSKHNEREFLSAHLSCRHVGVEHLRVDLTNIAEFLRSDLLLSGGEIPEGHYAEKTMRRTVVPFRNAIMLSVSCAIAESRDHDSVVIGNHSGDHAIYPDCRDEFIQAFRSAMAHGTYAKIDLLSPFVSLTKKEIVLLGDRLCVDWALTYSCYNGGAIHCGRCSTCFERREAFFLAGVTDPTLYRDKTPFVQLQKQYNERLAND